MGAGGEKSFTRFDPALNGGRIGVAVELTRNQPDAWSTSDSSFGVWEDVA